MWQGPGTRHVFGHKKWAQRSCDSSGGCQNRQESSLSCIQKSSLQCVQWQMGYPVWEGQSPQLISVIVWISAFLHRDWSYMMPRAHPLSPISSKVKQYCTASFSSPIADSEERQHLRGQLNDLCRTASAPQPITVAEVTEAIRSSKDSSPGPDCIKVDDYKHRIDNTTAELTNLYNSLHCRKVPEVWTDAFIGPVPKPAKGHRIIVMQNVIGKIPENVAARRFIRHIECVHPPGMGAYRPHRETWINPATVAANIWDGFEERVKQDLVGRTGLGGCRQPRPATRGVRSLTFLTSTPLRHILKFWTVTPAQTPKWIF